MRLSELLGKIVSDLPSDILQPQQTATTLLEHVTDLSWQELVTKGDVTLSDSEVIRLQDATDRIQQGEPLAYVVGYTEFHGCKFHVAPGVLIPRVETEQLVELLSDFLIKHADAGQHILDIGTGSGCIPISLLLDKGGSNIAKVTGIDPNKNSIRIAEENKNQLLSEIDVEKYAIWQHDVKSYLVEDNKVPEREQLSIIVSNPPYIKSGEMLTKTERSVYGYEPHLALDGGADGLDVYRDILKLVQSLPHLNAIFLELAPNIATECAQLFAGEFDSVNLVKDVFDRTRFLVGIR